MTSSQEIDSARNVIYAIRNAITGKQYIGSARHMLNRRSKHITMLNTGCHHSSRLQRAWEKHGPSAFRIVILEQVPCADFLRAREQFWLDRMKPRYNNSPYAMAGNPRGNPLPEAWRKKAAEGTRKLRMDPNWVNPMIGRKQSPEHADKSAAATRLWIERLRISGMPHPRKGAIASDELRAKRSASAARLWSEPEYREKAISARKGRAYNKGYKCSPEQIENRRRAGRISALRKHHGDRWREEYERRYG